MKKSIIWILLLLLAGGGTYWFRFRPAETQTGLTYDTTVVERGDLRITVESTGEVEPRNRLDIKSPIAGRLEELLVDEGETVQKGQILGWISSTERATLLDAALATSQEELKYWQELYKPTPLVSPLRGTVIARDFEPGQTISSSDSILTIADDLIIVANLDETDIGLILSGQSVIVTLEAYSDQPFRCEVEKIAFDAKTVSNVTMYDVDVRPLQLPSFARSGMTADLQFIIEEKPNTLTLPIAAIQQEPASRPAVGRRPEAAGQRPNGNGPKPDSATTLYVLTGSPDSPKKTTVQTGITDGSLMEITEGLKEGESILVPQVKFSSGKSKSSSLLMSGPGGGGPHR